MDALNPTPRRLTTVLVAAVGLTMGLATESRAQQSPTEVTLPLPESGVFYLRYGKPGGVRINSNSVNGQTADESAAAGAAPVDREALRKLVRDEMTAVLGDRSLARMSPAELELLQRESEDRVVQRLQMGAARGVMPSPGGGQSGPIIVLPNGQQAPAPQYLPQYLPQYMPMPGNGLTGQNALPNAGGATSANPLVMSIEREMLNTGLFRTTDVKFETAKSRILPSARPTLQAVGEVLSRYPELRIEVQGHTDSRASDAYNQRLSEARAASVRSFLISQFPTIQPDRIVARGYGESLPIAPNTNETTLALNRRVEFHVLNPEAAARIRQQMVDPSTLTPAAPTTAPAPGTPTQPAQPAPVQPTPKP